MFADSLRAGSGLLMTDRGIVGNM